MKVIDIPPIFIFKFVMKIILVFFLLFFTHVERIVGQVHPSCQTSEYFQKQITSNPALSETLLDNEAKIQKWTAYRRSARILTNIITIPVVVHIVYNRDEENISDARVHSQIEVLNKDFRRLNADTIHTPDYFLPQASDTRIQFKLATRDPNGLITSGIIRHFTSKTAFVDDDSVKFHGSGGASIWDRNNYLNIWVCNLPKWMLGYSQYPGVGFKETDGVVINYRNFGTIGKLTSPFDKGRTATHEIGHWLSLKHLWGDSPCGDDFVDDTPQQQRQSSFCREFPSSSCGNYSDMFMNFMDYSSDDCMNVFTIGQRNRMHATLATIRESLIFSKGADPIDAYYSHNHIFKLTPNPSQGFFIMNSFISGVFQIEIFDASGKMVFTKLIYNSFPQSNKINYSPISSGIYSAHVRVNEKVYINKLVILN